MGTAIGDLVVSLGIENQQFVSALNTSGASLDEFAGHAEAGAHGITELGEHGEEAGASATGASRAFGFLGKHIEELGEGIGHSNKVLGETVTGLGSTVAGLGEAVHGYHALHTSIEVATGAQALLNAISPVGWAVMAGGAIAAAGAYFYFTSGSKEAEEAAKKLAETQKEAGKEVDSAIASMQKEAAKLNSTPLAQFQEELEKTGRSADAIAEATEKFSQLQAEIASGKIKQALDKLDDEMEEKLRKLNDANKAPIDQLGGLPQGAGQYEKSLAGAVQWQEDAAKIQEKQARDEETRPEHAMSQVKSLIQQAQSPLDKLIESEHTLMQNFKSGLIDRESYESGLHTITDKAEEEKRQKRKEEKEEPLGALEANSSQAYDEIFKRLNPDEAIEPNKQTADNTAKANALLEEIRTHLIGSMLQIQ